jgi:hypothetical protein
LKIRLVRIRYQNAARNLNIAAPSLANFWTTAAYVLRTYPVPGIILTAESEALYDGDFTNISPGAAGIPGARGTTGTIFTILDRLVAAENPDASVRYLALTPGPPSNQSGFSGWAVGRLTISDVFNGPTMAQEFAHTFGRAHGPCGGPPGVDGCFPAYGNQPAGRIGEIGFDYVTSTVFDTNTVDFMTYCASPWVSPYTYEALMSSLPTS